MTATTPTPAPATGRTRAGGSRTGWVHVAGDEDGCLGCWTEHFLATYPSDPPGVCREPVADPDEPGVCGVCSHTVAPARPLG